MDGLIIKLHFRMHLVSYHISAPQPEGWGYFKTL